MSERVKLGILAGHQLELQLRRLTRWVKAERQQSSQGAMAGKESLPAEIQLKQARKKVVDYLKVGDPVREHVIDDAIEWHWDNAFVNMLAPGATREFYVHQKSEEWATTRAQRRGQISGYEVQELKFDYEVWNQYWDALRPFAPQVGKRHLQSYHDLKDIKREVEEETPQTQTSPQ